MELYVLHDCQIRYRDNKFDLRKAFIFFLLTMCSQIIAFTDTVMYVSEDL